MIKSFLKFLGGVEGEEKPMLLLLGKGFFMGVLLATYDIGASTLFLTTLGDSWLDTAFFFAGGAGILFTITFVYLQKKLPFATLVVSSTFVILLFIVALRLAFYFLDYSPGTAGEFHFLPFILFVMIGPITAIILLGFWGVFGRIFDLRQSKRIIGGIDTGQLMATMIAFFSIPLLTRVINATYDLLFISAIAAAGIFLFTLIIGTNFNLDKFTKKAEKEENAENAEKITFVSLFKNKYLRLLSVFLIFSMGAFVFVNFVFLSTTETMYENENELSTFLSFFSGTVIIVSFLIQSFVNDFIIGRFGLKIALWTMPLILILFTFGAIVSGHLFVYDIKTDEFILFFVLTAVGKLFTASLKDALESPAFKLFFLPLDNKIRFDVQTRIEGVVNELAVFLAGLSQMLLGLLAFFKLIHYSYFILILGGVMVYVASKLFEEYKKTLKQTMERQKSNLKGETTIRKNEHSVTYLLKNEIKNQNINTVFKALALFEKLEPIEFEFYLLDLLNHRNPKIRIFAYQKLNDRLCWEMTDLINKEFETEGDEEVLKVAQKTIDTFKKLSSSTLTMTKIKPLIRSTEAKDRVNGVRLLVKTTNDKYTHFVSELLRDINPEVRRAAIIVAGKLKRPEFFTLLIENLHISEYTNTAISALTSIGENAFYPLDAAFYLTNQHDETMLRIVQILGKINGKIPLELLWKKIDFPDRKITTQLFYALTYLEFKARDYQATRIKVTIDNYIGDIIWNAKLILEIPPSQDPVDHLLIEALKEEDKTNYDKIFILLGMIYDPKNIMLIKSNIDLDTTESVTFAIEMMNLFVEDEMKPKLLPIMDDIKPTEKLSKLQDYYAPDSYESYEDLLLQIINHDSNRINRYTKALAMYRIAQVSKTITPELIAHLFNSDKLLCQTAAFVIYSLNKKEYHEHTKRLKPVQKNELDKVILPSIYDEHNQKKKQKRKTTLIEYIIFMKNINIFHKIPGELIVYMVEHMKEVSVPDKTVLAKIGTQKMDSIFILFEGTLDLYNENDQLIDTLTSGNVLGTKEVIESPDMYFTMMSRSPCKLLILHKNDLLNLMSKHVEFIDFWLDIVNENNVDEKLEEENVTSVFG